MDFLDKEFVDIMEDIDQNYYYFKKHERIRVENWCKKLCEISVHEIWKKNRNLYAFQLLNCIKQKRLTEPFNRMPPEYDLPSLNASFQRSIKSPKQRKTLSIASKIVNRTITKNIPNNHRFFRTDISNTHHDIQNADYPKENVYQNLDSNSPSPTKIISLTSPNLGWKSLSNTNAEPRDGIKLRAKNTKYGFDCPKFEKDYEHLKNKKEIQTKLDRANLTVETLKDELEAQFKTIYQLNDKIEKINLHVDDVENGKKLFQSFLKVLKKKRKDKSNLFEIDSKSEEFLKDIDQLSKIFGI